MSNASNFQTAASLIMEQYKEQLKRQIETPLFWDRAFPVDRRPIYGPDTPSWVADGACGYIDCRCCQSWVNWYDYHDCHY